MISNSAFINFFSNNWIFLILVIFSLIKVIPSKLVRSPEVAKGDPKMTFLTLILESLTDSVSRSCFPLLAAFGLKSMIPFIIFAVVVFDIFVKSQISNQAVTLIAIGIIALYLDELVKTGKKISFFGVITWERKEGQ